MKKYSKTKDSEVEWIREIPEHWKVTKLKRICEIKYGSSLTTEERIDGEYSVFGSNGIVGKHNQAITKSETIILGRKGSLGEINFSYKPCFPIDTAFYLDQTSTKHNLRWLFYVLQILELSKLNQDSAVPGLSRSIVYEKNIPISNNSEEEKIAEFLDKETRKIDSDIEKNQKLIELLKEKRQSTINQAVTKGLDSTVPMKDSGVEWIREIPEHWKKYRQGHNCEFINGYAYSINEFTDSGYPIIRIQNLNGGKEFLFSNLKLPEKQFAYNGDLLFAWSATFGPYIWDGPKASFHYHQWKIVCNENLDKMFFYYYLAYVSEIVKSMSHSGINMIHMTKEKMEKLPIFLPKIDEQERIVEFLDQQTRKIDSLMSKIKTQIKNLQELRESLISSAVTGKIDVRGIVA